MSECKKCGTSTCCDYSYGCFQCAEDAAFEKGRKSMQATIAEQDRVIEAARAACDANKYCGEEMDDLAELLEGKADG